MNRMMQRTKKAQRRSNSIAITCAVVAIGMVGAAYAAVPLYDLFCRVTGYGGTTQQAEIAPDAVLDRIIRVEFDASVSRDMPWRFRPEQRAVDLKVGEVGLAFYEAMNPTDRPIRGQATYNVTPQKAGYYFTKIDCFCFTEQTLQPGERVDMPVQFFVDPSIADDPNLDDVTTITLSYTFFPLDPVGAAQGMALAKRQ